MDLYNIYTESQLVKTERDKLPDSSFGLPKTRQYPLHDAEHVRKAIQMFGNCPENNRRELANNIFKAAKKFDVEISEKSLVYRYLTASQQKEVSNRNDNHKKLSENNSMMSFVEFYQFPLNEETVEKYGKNFKELSVVSIKPDTKGLILVDKFDQMAGLIRLDTKTGYLKDIQVNPIYRKQGIGSKLLNTDVGKLASVTFIKSEDTKLQSFFENNGFTSKKFDNKIMLVRNSNLNEDSKIFIDSKNIDETVEKLNSYKDIVTETEDYLNELLEASVAGVACVAPLAGQTIRKPFPSEMIRKATKSCPNMFDYDEFYEPEEVGKFVCSENDTITANIAFTTDPVDVVKNTADGDKNSSSKIKKPQAMMENEKIIDYKDQSTSIIVGVDRYTCHKDENGCYYIKLTANEFEDKSKKSLILPYLNENMWITSDFHINHKNRNSANFANLLVSEINAKVPIDGTLMICGDLGNKGQLQKEYISDFIRKLNVSKKILLLGNHDNLSIQDYYDMGFTFVTDIIETDKYIFSHCPVNPKGKINIHGHIHEENEYWNMPAEGHINVYIHSHDDKVYQLKDYLRFYAKGKYKGKSVKKKFD